MESKKERQQITKDSYAHNLERLKQLQSQITCPKLQRCLELNGEVGASIWLTAMPYRHLGFELHQLEFVDAVCLRYGFEVRDLKSVCECGKQNSADHALSCAKGGYTILRHDGIRDLVAEMCVFVGLKAVQKEKLLQPCDNHALHFASNLAPDARMDVVANGLWRPFQTTYFDVRVFHPNSTSYLKTPIERLYRMNEAAKNQAYGRRVREVEGGSFTPLVMSTSGGMAKEFEKTLRRMASRVAMRAEEKYSQVINHLRTRLRFALLRACLIALRGERKRITPFVAAGLTETEYLD